MNKTGNKQHLYVPLWEKATLTIEEASEYSGIGTNRLRSIAGDEDCPFVLWVGNRKKIKRKQFDEYISKMYSI